MATRGAVLLSVILLVGTAGMAGLPVASAQDDPLLPAVYYGEVVVDDGELEEPIEVAAVADGAVQDTLTVEPDGELGGPAIADEKLEVQPPEDEAVSFEVAGERLTILEHEGETVTDDTISFEEGTQEVVLEVAADTLTPSFDVAITDAPTDVTAGDDATVEATVTNTGGAEATQTIELLSPAGDVVDNETTTLAFDQTEDVTFTWPTTTDDQGENLTLTVQSDDTTATTTLAVTADAAAQPPVAQPPAPPEDDAPAAEPIEVPAAVAVTVSERQTIASDEDFDVGQVRFSDTVPVEVISWNTAAISGEVGVAVIDTQNATDAGVAPPGQGVETMFFTVPDTAQDEPAFVDVVLNQSQLADAEITSAEDLRLTQSPDGTDWTLRETDVVDETAETVTLRAEVPGFSYLGVTATTPPAATIETAGPQTVGEAQELTAEATDQYGDIVAQEWTIDGTEATGETVQFTPETAGEVTVELTVENDAGLTETVTETLSIEAADEPEDDEPDDDEPEEPDDDGVGSVLGFGLAVAVLGLVVAGWLYARRSET